MSLNYMFNNACQKIKVSERLEIIQIDIAESTIFLSIEESVESNCLPHSSSEKESPSYISSKKTPHQNAIIMQESRK